MREASSLDAAIAHPDTWHLPIADTGSIFLQSISII